MQNQYSRRLVTLGAAALAATMLTAGITTSVSAQEWPSKPIRFFVGTPPGGPTDFISRIIADGLSVSLGQPVVVENRPGGGTTIGQAAIATSAPDGYTIGLITNAPTTAAPLLQKLPYTPDSFTPIAQVAEVPILFLAHPSLNVKTLAELIELVKANPDKYNYGSDGVGTVTHLGYELFKTRAGNLNVLHVPHKGSGEILTSYGSGSIQMSITGVQAALGHVKEGKITALAVTGTKRLDSLPDVPTVGELDLPGVDLKGVDLSTWFAVGGPAGLPPEIQERLNRDILAILNEPTTKQKIEAVGGIQVKTGSSQDLADVIAQSRAQWQEAINTAKITIGD